MLKFLGKLLGGNKSEKDVAKIKQANNCQHLPVVFIDDRERVQILLV